MQYPYRMGFRATENERIKLQAAARITGESMSEFTREATMTRIWETVRIEDLEKVMREIREENRLKREKSSE